MGWKKLVIPAVLGGGVILVVMLRWRRNPSACPYGQRFWLEAPRPVLTRKRLDEVLAPRSGERILEVGPGTGHYSLPVARVLGEEGRLDVVDVQQDMLDHTLRRANEAGLSNIVPTSGDARTLPYPDGVFDAAYLITVLGEVPDQSTALSELHRVLKPDGRLIVGELFPDPHMVPFGKLRERAEAAGLSFEHRLGGRLGYYARFVV